MPITLHPRILELIASRICHDMVSPVGAVSNGVELVQELGADAGEEAMQLIANSAAQASVRLKVFRLSYGAAGTDKNIGFRDIRDVFTELLSAGHIKVNFAPGMDVAFSMPPRGFFKTLLNLLIFAEECTHGEGALSITAEEGNKGMTVTVTGKNPGFREGAEAALKGETGPEDLDPRSVHAYITGKFATWFGLGLTWDAVPASGRLVFHLTF